MFYFTNKHAQSISYLQIQMRIKKGLASADNRGTVCVTQNRRQESASCFVADFHTLWIYLIKATNRMSAFNNNEENEKKHAGLSMQFLNKNNISVWHTKPEVATGLMQWLLTVVFDLPQCLFVTSNQVKWKNERWAKHGTIHIYTCMFVTRILSSLNQGRVLIN